MVLVGPSGSGKTTALRMLAGPRGGRRGRDLDRRPRRHLRAPKKPRRRDGLPELRALPVPDRRGEHRLPAQDARRCRRRSATRACARSRELLGLEEYLERKPAQLSGGQRQRVAMGRAIVREPSVFLMDEPLSNLDAKLRVQMRADIAALQARARRDDGLRHARPVGGDDARPPRRRAQATAGCSSATRRATLYERPANTFVAGFIGSPAMNLCTVPLGTNGSVVARRRRRPHSGRPRAGARAGSCSASGPSRSSSPPTACRPGRGRRGARRRRLRLLLAELGGERGEARRPRRRAQPAGARRARLAAAAAGRGAPLRRRTTRRAAERLMAWTGRALPAPRSASSRTRCCACSSTRREYAAAPTTLARRAPDVIRLVGHGSSDNAASYGVYAFGLLARLDRAPRLDLAHASTTAPSIDFAGSAVVALSQSGRTPDVVEYVERARAARRADRSRVTNEPGLELAEAAELVAPARSGPGAARSPRRRPT